MELPPLGFGTYKLMGDACADAVADALRIGYRHVDTASMYENEGAVGQGVRASGIPRADVFVTTKVWRSDLAPKALVASADASLERLGTEYVDLLLVHWPHPEIPLEDTMEALVRVQEAGKARFIGVSNFPPSLFEQACVLGPVACNQVEYHVFLSQEDLRARARAHGAWLSAYRPVNKGQVDGEPILRDIAAAHGATPAQVALAWLLGQERVAAIPKAASPENRRANLAARDLMLHADERAAIDRLSHRNLRSVDPDWGPDWER